MNNNDDQRNEDINAQARKAGTTPEHLQKERAQGSQHASQTSDQQTAAAPGQLQDGYRLNEGGEYSTQPSSDEQQDNYDPTHSGVRHAQNKPGERTNNPGREGQGGWAEQLQMGQTSDTPNRKNPAD